MRARLSLSAWIVSRGFNGVTGGSFREMFCGRVHRKGWPIERPIDWIYYAATGRHHHCRTCAIWDDMTRGRQ